VTPIKVDRLESLLHNHPNHDFVQSVCRGLREGFWPWAKTDCFDRPVTFDNSRRPLRDESHHNFIREQVQEEIKLGQYSPTFGPNLLPGMYSQPIGVVPKPHSDKFRLVIDQSAEPFALNDMIAKEESRIHLDNLHNLGDALRRVRMQHGEHVRLVCWKSDVSRAYRLIPMHPHWQILQVVTVGDTERHVNRCNQFGNRAGGRVFAVVNGLILWVGVFVEGIEDLFAYVDDSFSWDFEGNLTWYAPYQKAYPTKQTRLLQLWDHLGIPHEERKQVFGAPVTIIGMSVDPNLMTITMPEEARHDLVNAIQSFTRPNQRRSLREFQSLAGWISWSLNAYPLLRPGLSTLYQKMSGKSNPHGLIWVSVALRRELLWLSRHLESANGVYVLDANQWGETEANFICYADACPSGLGFWSFDSLEGFQSDYHNDLIFFSEAYAVLSALHYALNHSSKPSRVLVFTDNTNTVDMFHSLHASPLYNPILLTAVDLLMSSKAQLRVHHVPGEYNIVADALSRFKGDVISRNAPYLSVSTFQPPRLTLGASLK